MCVPRFRRTSVHHTFRTQTRPENVRCIVRSRERTTSLVHSRAWPPRHARECTILFVHSRDCNSRNKKTKSSARKLVTRMYGTFCRAFTRPQNATRMPSEDPQGRLGHSVKGVTPRRCNAGDLAAGAEAAHHSLCICDVFILLPPGSSELFSNQQAS